MIRGYSFQFRKYFFISNNKKQCYPLLAKFNNPSHFSTIKDLNYFSQKYKSGRYIEILGYQEGTKLNKLTQQQLRRQYLYMIKKYHSDYAFEQDNKLQYEEITKYIILAYDIVSAQRIKEQINSGTYKSEYKYQDLVSMKLYKKKFNEVKYEIFREDNYKQRMIFMEQLRKAQAKDPKYNPYHNQKSSYRNQQYRHGWSSNFQQPRPRPMPKTQQQKYFLKLFMCLGAFACLILLGRVQYYKQKSEELTSESMKSGLSEKFQYDNGKVEQLEQKFLKIQRKKKEQFIALYTRQQPPCLEYPTDQDPPQLDQLIQYTIGSDIHLYEIPFQFLQVDKNLEKLTKVKNFEEIRYQEYGNNSFVYPINKAKPNTVISLSLQAERCLQNIYIKVSDVAEQIKRTGKYTPPKVCFKFYGYILFELRDKPLSQLKNYRQTQYISLFDLFFDYYSPILIKRNKYKDYVVGLKQIEEGGPIFFGQVHLNNRKIPQLFITKDDKFVVMVDPLAQVDKQLKYRDIWRNFYRNYQSQWRNNLNDKNC